MLFDDGFVAAEVVHFFEGEDVGDHLRPHHN